MRFIFLLFALLCVSCNSVLFSEKVNEAAGTAAGIFKAKGCSIGFEKNASTSNGSHNTLVLTIDNPTSVDSSYPHEAMTSAAALAFLKSLSAADYEGYDQLQIAFTGKSSFDKTYSIARLEKTIAALPVIDSFFVAFKKNDDNALKKLCDSRFPDSSRLYILSFYPSIDSIFGAEKKHTINAFKYEYSEALKENLVKFLAQARHANGIVNYEFYITEEQKKLVYVHFKGDPAK